MLVGRLGEAVAKAHYCSDLSPPPRPEKVSLAEASSSFPPVPQIHSFIGQQLCITPYYVPGTTLDAGETSEKKEPCSTYPQSNREAPNTATKHSATDQNGSQTFISCVNDRSHWLAWKHQTISRKTERNQVIQTWPNESIHKYIQGCSLGKTRLKIVKSLYLLIVK